ncbi:MAG: hypothetical protein M0P61_10460 [Ignavibacteriaceae bacterium]|jgi:hypothetical protein|nr:hypothetical protein [Ignavibacteriaceae bacterium]
MTRILGLLLLSAVVGFGQYNRKNIFEPKLENNKLTVADTSGKIIFEKHFNEPAEFFVELSDGPEIEYLIRDKKIVNGIPKYFTFVYSIKDTFSLIDTLYSGVYEPVPFYSDELDRTLLLTGNPDFDSLYSSFEHEYFSSINCIVIEEGKLYNVNDLVYDVYLQENEQAISFIESTWSGSAKDCSTSTEIKSAVAAVYVNYLNAGEKVLARQFLNDYYLCPDKESFKNFLDSQF